MDTNTMKTSFHPDHWADLLKSGLSEDTLRMAKVYSVRPGDIPKRLGFNPAKVESMLAFPYPGTDFERYKVFPVLLDEKGHKVKYLQKKGSGTHLYIPDRMKEKINRHDLPIYITEGEKKALKACQEGLPCVGIGGVWNWKGEDGVIPEIQGLAQVNRSVYLVPDSDFNQNEGVLLAMYRLGKELEKMGVLVKVVCLPSGPSGEKVGLDDYLLSFSIEDFNKIPSIQLNHTIFSAFKKQTKRQLLKTDEKQIYSAHFDGLVDIAEKEGRPVYLILKDDKVFVDDCFELDDGKNLTPPPTVHLPTPLPRVDEIVKYAEMTKKIGPVTNDRCLMEDLINYHKNVSELPSEAHYVLLAVWVMHTYLMESFDYSPILSFFAVPERGKSRTGKGLIYVAYRGIHTETLQEANLFRWSEDLRATIFLDVRDLWSKAEKKGADDVLLSRFEKGLRVSRVLYPEKGPFQDTRNFNVFGPTILATNEPLHDILDTRCLPIVMPQTTRKFSTPVTPETALPLKERLVEFRSRHMGKPLPFAENPASGRLGDILKPLIQMIRLANPPRESDFLKLVKEIERGRKMDKSQSLEAEIIEAIVLQKDHVERGFLPVSSVLETINSERSERFRLSPQKVGRKLKSLGFEPGKTGTGNAAIRYDEAKIDRLKQTYGLGETKETPERPKTVPKILPLSDVSGVSDLSFEENKI